MPVNLDRKHSEINIGHFEVDYFENVIRGKVNLNLLGCLDLFLSLLVLLLESLLCLLLISDL